MVVVGPRSSQIANTSAFKRQALHLNFAKNYNGILQNSVFNTTERLTYKKGERPKRVNTLGFFGPSRVPAESRRSVYADNRRRGKDGAPAGRCTSVLQRKRGGDMAKWRRSGYTLGRALFSAAVGVGWSPEVVGEQPIFPASSGCRSGKPGYSWGRNSHQRVNPPKRRPAADVVVCWPIRWLNLGSAVLDIAGNPLWPFP